MGSSSATGRSAADVNYNAEGGMLNQSGSGFGASFANLGGRGATVDPTMGTSTGVPQQRGYTETTSQPIGGEIHKEYISSQGKAPLGSTGSGVNSTQTEFRSTVSGIPTDNSLYNKDRLGGSTTATNESSLYNKDRIGGPTSTDPTRRDATTKPEY